MTVFKIYIHGISDSNLIFRSDTSVTLTEYGDTILSPKLKKETNKADSFEFIILPTHDKYDSFEKKRTFVYLTRDGKCIFRGRVSDITTDIYKQRTITCEGDLAFLSDSILSPNKKNSTSNAGSTKKQQNKTLYSHAGGEPYSTDKSLIRMTPAEYFRQCIAVHNAQMVNDNKNFEVGSITITGKNVVGYFERTSYQDTSSTISSDLLSVYGGVLRTRYENNKAYIDWLDNYTESNSQEIRFGVNMIDLDQEPPTDELWTVLLPTGEDNCTLPSGESEHGMLLVNTDMVAKYGYIVHHHSFSDVKKSSELGPKARKYMSMHCKEFPNNLIIKAVDLQLIGESNDPLELGDKIKVVSSPHNLNTTMACISMELDIFNPENNSYTIGPIMPPDKDAKKEPISEKHRSSSRSASRGIMNNANAIDGLKNDVNVNANNINVNAENIAVNALNIAVNAENIAVVAKNISIAAETIDIKAQEITATFGEETEELYGHITTSAEGIKTEFHNNTTGLSSYFTQEAGKITAAVENADASIRSKIELTESSLISQFNQTIYGEDGIVVDYEGKITQTSQSLTSDYTHQITDAEGRITGAYEGKITQTSASLTSDYTTKISDAKREITEAYEGKITQTSSSLTSDYTTKISNAKEEITKAYESKITQTSQSIRTEVSKKVGTDEIISRINQTAEAITISASKIDLSGYVTATQLQTTNANITNLANGTTKASYLLATKMKVATGNFYIGDEDNKSGKFYYHGTEYYDVTISMPNVGETNGFLGWAYKNGSYSTTLSLAHSHSVKTNPDGTITIGGTVATDATNRSFKIADTKAYKDGVSAAINSVRITDIIRQQDTDEYGDPKDKEDFYNSSTHNFVIYAQAIASNGKTLNKSISVKGERAYQTGWDSVGITSFARRKYSNTGTTVPDTYDSNSHNSTVHVGVTISNGKYSDKDFTVSGSRAFEDGVESVTIKSIRRKKDPDTDETVSDTYDYDTHNSTIHIESIASNDESSTKDFTVSGSNAYNDGQESVTVDSIQRRKYSNVDQTVPDTYDSNSHDSQVHVVATASNGNYLNADLTVSGSRAYEDGVESVSIDYLGRQTYSDGSYVDDAYIDGYYQVHIKASTSNGFYGTEVLSVNAAQAYNSGYDQGENDGYAEAKSDALVHGKLKITQVTIFNTGEARVDVKWGNDGTNFSVASSKVTDLHN